MPKIIWLVGFVATNYFAENLADFVIRGSPLPSEQCLTNAQSFFRTGSPLHFGQPVILDFLIWQLPFQASKLSCVVNRRYP